MGKMKSMMAVALVAALGLGGLAFDNAAYDVTKPENSGEAFVRMRADTSGADVIADWQTTVFIVEPGKRALAVMRLDGFNVGRATMNPDGSYDVIQVINDSVNSVFGRPGSSLPWRVKGDDVFVTVDVPLAYPNALPPADFPEESTGPMYFATESFMFFFPTRRFC
jgi:hypothetical protein